MSRKFDPNFCRIEAQAKERALQLPSFTTIFEYTLNYHHNKSVIQSIFILSTLASNFLFFSGLLFFGMPKCPKLPKCQ